MFQARLLRIDCRVVHGQIAIYWAGAADAKMICVVDEAISKNAFLSNMYKAAAPQSIKAVEVYSPDSFMEAYEKGQLADENVLMIFKDVANCHALWKKGFPFPNLNIGNLPAGPKKKQILREVFLSPEEFAKLKEIEESGVDTYIQVIPSQSKMTLQQASAKLK